MNDLGRHIMLNRDSSAIMLIRAIQRMQGRAWRNAATPERNAASWQDCSWSFTALTLPRIDVTSLVSDSVEYLCSTTNEAYTNYLSLPDLFNYTNPTICQKKFIY